MEFKVPNIQLETQEKLSLKTKIKTKTAVLVLILTVAAAGGLLAAGFTAQKVQPPIPPDATVTIVSPNGGEFLDVTQPYEIQWQAHEAFSDFSIYYYENENTKGKKIASKIKAAPNNEGFRTYFWNPSASKLTEDSVKDKTYRIEITSKAGKTEVSDKSDSPFFIVPSNIPTVTLKINGETKPASVKAPASLKVSWTTTAPSQMSDCSGTGQDWDGTKPAAGGKDTISKVETGIYTYTISCNKIGGGTVQSRATILVKPALPKFDIATVQERAINQSQKSDVNVFFAGHIVQKLADQAKFLTITPKLRASLAMNLATSLDFNRKIAEASGAKSTGTTAPPEIESAGSDIYPTVIWFNNTIPRYGVRLQTGNVFLKGLPIDWPAVVGVIVYTNDPAGTPNPVINGMPCDDGIACQIGAAVSPDGKIFKVTTKDAQGTLNLTLDYSDPSKVIWKTTGWLNSKGDLTGNTNILAAISRLATARHYAHSAKNKPEPQKSQQINGLFFASAMFSGSLYNAEKYLDIMAFGVASESQMDALLDATYDNIQDYVEYSNTPTVYYIPNQVERLACRNVTYTVPGATEIYYEFDEYWDDITEQWVEVFTPYEIPGGDYYVTESICHVATVAVYQEVFSYPTWADYMDEVRETDVVIDALPPSEFDSSFINIDEMEQFFAGKDIFIEKSAFTDAELTLMKFDFNSLIDKLGPSFRDKLKSVDVFILGEEGYRGLTDAFIQSELESGILDPDMVKKETDRINGLCGYNTESNIVVFRGICLLEFADIFTPFSDRTAEDAILHEYAHALERNNDGSMQFSGSDEWRAIGAEARQIGREAFVSWYAMDQPAEDFAESVVYYYVSGGNPAKLSPDPAGQALIKKRFDYLKRYGIVN